MIFFFWWWYNKKNLRGITIKIHTILSPEKFVVQATLYNEVLWWCGNKPQLLTVNGYLLSN